MKMTIWIEGMILLGAGLIALVDGLRLIHKIDPDAIRDILGPGYYIFSLGLILMITGITYFFINYKKIINMQKEVLDKGTEKQKINLIVFYMVVVLIFYLIFINIAGYLVPTLIFFSLEFRLAGVKSWKGNILLTSVVTAVFYLIFIQYCRMVFPHGLIFK